MVRIQRCCMRIKKFIMIVTAKFIEYQQQNVGFIIHKVTEFKLKIYKFPIQIC
jgi:hypothetical protein